MMNLTLFYYLIIFFVIAGLIFFLFSCSSLSYQKSDHCNGKEFFNLYPSQMIGLKDVIYWQATRKPKKWPDLPPKKNNLQLPFQIEEGKFAVTFINHATVLIQTKEINILTDPVYLKRVGPFSWTGPKRYQDPGIDFNNLPQIHFVILSHNHYDHMDLPSLKMLEEKYHPVFIAPLGNQKFLLKEGLTNVIEMDWHENYRVNDTVFILFLPALHWSGRGIRDRMESLWGSYLIKIGTKTVFFAGDTAYHSGFKDFGDKYGPVTLSLLPIGAYEPRWFMKHHHMDPQDAVNAHVDLKSQLTVPVHYGTFNLSDEGFDDPVRELMEEIKAKNLNSDDFAILELGETVIR